MNILLSIKPKYTDLIELGIKKYEFRKSIFKIKSDNVKVYIYSSMPVKKIIGFFTIESIIKDRPYILWDKYNTNSGIDKVDFFKYFKDKNLGYAIKIKNLHLYKNPINPYTEFKNFIPPQSFSYFDEITIHK